MKKSQNAPKRQPKQDKVTLDHIIAITKILKTQNDLISSLGEEQEFIKENLHAINSLLSL